jgi:hypothetical protein
MFIVFDLNYLISFILTYSSMGIAQAFFLDEALLAAYRRPAACPYAFCCRDCSMLADSASLNSKNVLLALSNRI